MASIQIIIREEEGRILGTKHYDDEEFDIGSGTFYEIEGAVETLAKSPARDRTHPARTRANPLRRGIKKSGIMPLTQHSRRRAAKMAGCWNGCASSGVPSAGLSCLPISETYGALYGTLFAPMSCQDYALC